MRSRTLNRTNRKYDVPFDVLECVTHTDANKVKTKDWECCHRLYAFVKSLHGAEYEQARHDDAKYTIKLITKYGPTIDESMRIRLNGKVYDIEHIDNIEMQNEELEIRAVERVRHGN